jgi:hypothetical protein
LSGVLARLPLIEVACGLKQPGIQPGSDFDDFAGELGRIAGFLGLELTPACSMSPPSPGRGWRAPQARRRFERG